MRAGLFNSDNQAKSKLEHDRKSRKGDVGTSEYSGGSSNVSRSNGRSYSDTAKLVKIGIMLTNYPKVQMSTEQLDALQEALLLKIEMQRNEDVKPKFAKCSYKQGYLALDCKDQITANWLKDVTGSLSPWDNAELIALDVKDIPRPDTFHAFFPLSADFSDERLKGLIESQNDGLSTNGWKILNRTNANKHAEWLLNVDEDSLAILSKRNFVLSGLVKRSYEK